MARRTNGDGCVRKRTDGRWEGIYYTGELKNGKAVRKSVLAKTKAECLEKLNKSKKDSFQAQQIMTRCAFLDNPEPTMKEWYEIWLESFGKAYLKDHTRISYEAYFTAYILPRIGNLKLQKISTVTCQQMFMDIYTNGRVRHREKQGAGLSAKTVKDVKVALQVCLQKAEDEGIIDNNPVRKVQLPKEPKKEMQTLKTDEVGRFLEEAKKSECYEFYLLELTTGLRLGEILALTWEDFNDKERTLRVNKAVQRIGKDLIVTTPKTQASIRTIKLCDECAINLILLRTRQARISEMNLMFPSPITNGLRDPGSVVRKLHRMQKRAGLPKIRFHDLRHSFATISLDQGQDIKTISHMLGHTDAGFTMNTYMHVTDSMQENVANALGDLIKEKEKNPITKVIQFPA